ncbi:hypothetical protein CHS0354_027662 [Potamilus streckersoni]|uniref:TRP C-terminal domain-containing protein n=1 Tax=Potamilus streckersoni TaxID=2493646 RepID=A0AAE0T0F1_9BIVA|nr:hypothetical protein CHS0354_027662 [Potamilus streckersoni]
MFPKCTSKELVLDLTKDVYLLDNGRSCAEFIFQTLQFVAVIYLVVFSLLFPFLLVFFTLRQRKWNLLDTDRMKYGPVYDAYNNRYCFWEAIVLLRLLISLCLTDTYPIGPFIQVYGQLTLTGLYLLLVIAFRPYRTMAWTFCNANNHIIFEVVSNLCLGFVQIISHPIFKIYWNIVEIISLVFICLVLLLWVVLLFGICCEIKESNFQGTMDESSMIGNQTRHKVKFLCWRSNAVGQDPSYTAELQEKKVNLDF